MNAKVEPLVSPLPMQAASQDMYAATQEAEGGQAGPDAGAQGAQGGDDEVTDVDFEEVKEEEAK
mgnify:CR=1 FL=1